jgi:hypothetical protein
MLTGDQGFNIPTPVLFTWRGSSRSSAATVSRSSCRRIHPSVRCTKLIKSETCSKSEVAYDYRSGACVGNLGLATTGGTGSKHQPRPFDVRFLTLWK